MDISHNEILTDTILRNGFFAVYPPYGRVFDIYSEGDGTTVWKGKATELKPVGVTNRLWVPVYPVKAEGNSPDEVLEQIKESIEKSMKMVDKSYNEFHEDRTDPHKVVVIKTGHLENVGDNKWFGWIEAGFAVY